MLEIEIILHDHHVGLSKQPKAYSMQPIVADMDSLNCFPFIDGEVIEEQKTKLPVYLANCAADTGENFCAMNVNGGK